MQSSTRVARRRYNEGDKIFVTTLGEKWEAIVLSQNTHTGSCRVRYITGEFETVAYESLELKVGTNEVSDDDQEEEGEGEEWSFGDDDANTDEGDEPTSEAADMGMLEDGLEKGSSLQLEFSELKVAFSTNAPNVVDQAMPGAVREATMFRNKIAASVVEAMVDEAQTEAVMPNATRKKKTKRGKRNRAAGQEKKRKRKAETRAKLMLESGHVAAGEWKTKEFIVEKKNSEEPVGKFASHYRDASGNPSDEIDTSDYEIWEAEPTTIHYYYDESLQHDDGLVGILIGRGVYNCTLVKPKEVYGTLAKMGKYVKVEMREKRAIDGRGMVRHFGLRYRNEEQNHTGKGKLSVVLKADDVTEQQHRSWCANTAHVAGALIDAVRMAEPNLVNSLENLMSQTVKDFEGKACSAYPACSAGLNGGYSCHFDFSDEMMGTLAAFGKDGAWIAMPQYEAMFRMNDGDVLVLNSPEVLHSNVTHPNPPQNFQRATMSLYWNKRQVGWMKGLKRLENEDAKRATNGMAECAHAFWTSLQPLQSTEDSVNIVSTMPSHCEIGLISATNHFSVVKLWAYGEIQGPIRTHTRIQVCDANEVLPLGAAKRLLEMGASIAHVSDFVRILAAGKTRGWIIDCDNIWIRNPPSQSGHVFATLAPYITGAYRKPPEFWQQCGFQEGKEGYWDGKGLINFPCLFEPHKPYSVDFVVWVNQKVQHHQSRPWPHGKTSWNMVMWAMRDLVLKHKLQADVHPWWHFSPTPAMPGQRLRLLSNWFDKKAPDRTRFGITYPSTDRIMRLAYCVAVFCNSTSATFNADGKGRKDQHDGSLYDIIEERPDSLLSKLWAVVQKNSGHQ